MVGMCIYFYFFFFQAEDGIRDGHVTGVQTCALPILASLKGDLPDDVNLDVVIDTSEFIQMSIDSVVKNMLIGGAISVLVLLLFLKSVRATIVIGLSISISLIVIFALM